PATDRRTRWSADTRDEFLRGRRATVGGPPLQDEDAPATACEVRRGDEAVVSAADDDDVERLGHGSHPEEGPVSQNFARGVEAGCSHHATSWMGSRAAQVEPFEGHAVLRPSGGRSEEEQLVRREFPVEDVAARQPDHLLEVPRAEELAVEDDVADARDVLLDRVEDRLAEFVAALFPCSLSEAVWRILDET